MTDKIHSTDKALIEAANTGQGVVQITPELAEQIGQNITERRADIESRYSDLVKACDEETKLAVTAWVFENILAHMKEPGSFRYLIYDRLGFGPEAYIPLYDAGGLEISNACHDLSNNE